jgi:hypothetical protein
MLRQRTSRRSPDSPCPTGRLIRRQHAAQFRPSRSVARSGPSWMAKETPGRHRDLGDLDAWLTARLTVLSVRMPMTGCEHVSEAGGLPAPLYAIPADPRFHAGRHPQTSPARVEPSNPTRRSTSSGPFGQPAERSPWQANSRGGPRRRHALESGRGNQRVPPPCRMTPTPSHGFPTRASLGCAATTT